MIVAALVVIVGLLLGIGAVQFRGLRLSGVIVVPLLAVYTLYDFAALPVFVVGVLAAYAGLAVLKRRTLLFGRSLLLAAIAIGAVVPLLSVSVPSMVVDGSPLPQGVIVLGSVLPGIAAYNYHKLDGRRRVVDVLASVVAFTGITVLGGALINPTTAAAFGSLTPPMLFSASADIATLRGAGITSVEFSSVVPRSVELFALVLGAGVSEFVYARWGIRINGLIAAPLLVLFSLVHPTVVPVYVVGTALVYALITLVNRQTLLYGRVLLSTAIVLAVGLAIPAAVFGPTIPGSVLLFTAIIAGIGAYNLHRVPPRERSASALVSAGLFVGLFGAVRLAPGVPTNTVPFDSVPYAAVGLLVLVLCATSVLALERRRRPVSHTERRDRSEVPW